MLFATKVEDVVTFETQEGWIKKISEMAKGNFPAYKGPLAAEIRAVEIGKSLALLLFNQALIKYGQDVMNHQQLGELLSNLFIDLYAMDSTVSRVSQGLNNGKFDETWMKIATTFCAEKIYQICNKVEMGIYSLLTGNDLEMNLKQIQGLRDQIDLHCDIFKMKSEIAEDLYSHGEYRF